MDNINWGKAFSNVNVQVKLFSETLINIFMNFVPNKLIVGDDTCFITSYDAHLSHCGYTIIVCSVFNIILPVLVFYQNRMYDHSISCHHVSSGF